MVEQIDCPVNVLLRYCSEGRFLWEELPQESVGVLIRTAFPCVVRVREINIDSEITFDHLVISHLRTVIERTRETFFFRDRGELLVCCRAHLTCSLVLKLCCDLVSRFSFREGRDEPGASLPHDRIALPVTDASPLVHDLRTHVDAAFLGLFSRFFTLFRSFLSSVLTLLATEIALQVGSFLSDPSIDRSVRDHGGTARFPKVPGDLLGRIVPSEPELHDVLQVRIVREFPEAFVGTKTAFVRFSLRFPHRVRAV